MCNLITWIGFSPFLLVTFEEIDSLTVFFDSQIWQKVYCKPDLGHFAVKSSHIQNCFFQRIMYVKLNMD